MTRYPTEPVTVQALIVDTVAIARRRREALSKFTPGDLREELELRAAEDAKLKEQNVTGKHRVAEDQGVPKPKLIRFHLEYDEGGPVVITIVSDHPHGARDIWSTTVPLGDMGEGLERAIDRLELLGVT